MKSIETTTRAPKGYHRCQTCKKLILNDEKKCVSCLNKSAAFKRDLQRRALETAETAVKEVKPSLTCPKGTSTDEWFRVTWRALMKDARRKWLGCDE